MKAKLLALAIFVALGGAFVLTSFSTTVAADNVSSN
jgi:hypothetical protein